MSQRKYIEVSYDTYCEAQSLLQEATREYIDVDFLSQVRLELIDPAMEPERFRAQLDIHNLCLFMVNADPGWLIVISDQPDGTTIDWVLGR